MKRRAISFITVLALCLSLCPMRAWAAGGEPEAVNAAAMISAYDADSVPGSDYKLTKNTSITGTRTIKTSMEYILNGYSYTSSTATVLKVEGTGALYLKTDGKIESANGAGIEVAAGGYLFVTAQDITIAGTTYGLDISSGAKVQLSGGTYTGGTAAIRATDYGALLKDGYAFFDESGKPIPLTEVAGKKTVTVKMCTDHSYGSYTPNDGVPTHDGICKYCKTKAFAGSCTFDFDKGNGNPANCNHCGRTLKIEVTVDDLTYNGTDKAASVDVKVTLDADKQLTSGTDYDCTVEPSSRVDVGDFTVTVTGITYNGTYTVTYDITKAEPVLTWAKPDESVDYDGSPVEKDIDLPKVNIEAPKSEELVDLLVFSYREKNSGAEFTDGLPTDAGTYEIKARLPEQENYKEAVTGTYLELTINKINPIKKAPEAIKNLVYNHSAQNLVTRGEVWDGAVILFALDKGNGVTDSDYSEAIPTGINAGEYTVYYKVKGTNNYLEVVTKEPTAEGTENDSGVVTKEPIKMAIQRKEITPDVRLEYTSCVYDGGKKEPTVTVTDPEDNWELPSTEYTVDYDNNQEVSKTENPAKVTVKNAEGGNYTIIPVEREFKITAANQGALTITKTPDKVIYGDVFTLETAGGSGNGTVTWEIIGSNSSDDESTTIAKINPASGQVTVTGIGTVTVRATKAGETNHENATAEWTFTADPKRVTATVTAQSRPYKSGDSSAAVNAEVSAQDIVSGDTITITMPDGSTFKDGANAGTNKSVDVVTTGATITVNGKETNFDTNKKYFDTGNYIVTFSSAPVTADITPKEVTPAVTLAPNPDSSSDTDKEYYEYDGKAKEPTVTVKYEENNETKSLTLGTDYTVTYSNNVNVGTAIVTVKAKVGGNYTFPDQTVTFEITGGAILTSSPTAKDLTYTGQPQELVTVGTATGGQLVYALANTSDKTAEGADDKPEPGDYKTEIPQKTEAGLYKVYYKVRGAGNYADTEPAYVFVTIKPKTVTNPVIELDLTPENFNVYDGKKKEPEVTSVKDGDTNIWVKGTDGDANSEFIITYSNNVNVGQAIVHIISRKDGNYYVDGSTTFEITKATAKFADGKGPKENDKLVYKGKPLELVTPGIAEGGTAVYSLDDKDGTYKPEIPTGTDCKPYTVWVKVLGDANHEDSEPIEISAAIGVNEVEELTVELSFTSFRYNGNDQKPTITVKDDDGDVISDDQYTVAYYRVTEGTGDAEVTGDIKDVGTYKIKITAGGNYSFNEEREFTITPAEQTPLKITEKPNVVYYGNEFQLKTEGGLAGVTVEWSIEEGKSEGRIEQVIGADGKFKITGTGRIIIKATKKSANYEDVTDTWEFYAEKRPLTVTGVTPKKGADGNPLIYDGNAQALVSIGRVEGVIAGDSEEAVGTVVYSLDNTTYGGNIPTGTDAGTYIVWYKVIAKDANYKDSEPEYVKVEIGKKGINAGDLTVTCSPKNFPYDGTQKTPDIIVTYKEGDNAKEIQIPDSEYTVAFDPPLRMEIGKYTVTVKAKSDGNYTFTGGDVTGSFEILPSAPLSIVTDKPTDVYFGDTFTLSTAGGIKDDNIAWEITDEKDKNGSKVTSGAIAAIDRTTGKVTVNGVGSFTVTVTKGEVDEDSVNAYNTASITFTAKPKPVTAVVTAKDKVYNGWTSAALTVTVPVDGITITVNSGIVGRFDSADVGTNKTVTFTLTENDVTVGGDKKDNYAITYPITGTTTASITPADVTVPQNGEPQAENPTYNGSAQPLLAAGGTLDGGDWVYSVDGSNYSLTIPTAVYAGDYIVKYKVLADSNHKDSEEKSVTVTIDKAMPKIIVYPKAESVKLGDPLSKSELTGGKATCDGVEVPGAFTWKDPAYMPAITTKREAVFTPYDRTNYYVVEGIMITVEVIKDDDSSGGDDTSNSAGTPEEPVTEFIPPQTSVQNGIAIAALAAEAGDELVNEAVANESKNIVIRPEITGDVTKTEVSLPATAVSRISSETDAALTVSTPIADVTIPNAALDMLSSAGNAVSVVTEKMENTVVLTLTADGKDVGDIPGGLTLTVPVEDIVPGTVAVLVYEDGTRETIRKSVAEDGGVRIPLNGSATVEIVDNSKEFADVPTENWAADAVAFASAHELFNGTSETTFSPELTMSRAMLATVLYNLEGRPDQGITNGEFSDVNSGTWYTEGVLWAAENGIVSGYGDGQFGPNDSITREQLAVMIWRYVGSPAADEQTLNFTDADQISSYAMEALCWAIANGLMRGPGDGHLDPGGITTRAQAAQMLKNFLENT